MDAPDLPRAHMFFGKATGAAHPLLWAHAEYVKLLRSIADGKVFDLIEPVAERYRNADARPSIEVWKINRQVKSVPVGCLLRVLTSSPFSLHWSDDEWVSRRDSTSTRDIHRSGICGYRDCKYPDRSHTIHLLLDATSQWQGSDYQVEVVK